MYVADGEFIPGKLDGVCFGGPSGLLVPTVLKMSAVLYSNGKLIGEISNWENTQTPPEYKTFLGKTVLVSKANDQCTFVSPKPVHRKDALVLVFDKKEKLILQTLKISTSLVVTALIKEKILV